jgi:O-antigen/teichoic acid export membrane protein
LFAIRGFLLAKILGPVSFGIWTEMRLAFMFLQYVRLGTNEAMLREYPFAMGKDDYLQAEKIRRTVTTFNIVSATIIIVVIFFILLLPLKIFDTETRYLWYGLLGIFFFRQVYWFVHLILQAERRFYLLSKIVVGFAMLSATTGLLLAYYYNLEGFLWALAFSYICTIVFAMKGKLSSLIRLGWNSALAGRLIKVGLPIMASGALFILLLNVDKLVIWIFLQREDLGIYAVQSYIVNVVILAPGTISMVLFPTVMEHLGRTDSLSQIEQLLKKLTLILGYLACPLLGVLYFLLHLPIKWLLPKYTLAIAPGQILVLATFFIVISRMPATILVSMNKQNLLFIISIFSVLGGVIIDYFLIQTGMGIVGVAFGTACSFFIYAMLTVLSSIWTLRISFNRAIIFLINLVAPYFCILVSVFITISLIPEKSDNWISDLIQSNVRCLVFLLPVCTLTIFVNQKMNFFNRKAFEIKAE